MRTSQIYMPLKLRDPYLPVAVRADYYLSVWPQIKEKWRKLGVLDIAFDKDNPLGQWRQIVQQLYGINLEL